MCRAVLSLRINLGHFQAPNVKNGQTQEETIENTLVTSTNAVQFATRDNNDPGIICAYGV